MNDAHQPQLDAPQLRTLLLTDLCDSTALVERIGDTAAAELFREHDHLVLTLQRQWRGRLIDRSDGLLLLFERPIDGLGFALDYVHCLKDLGDSRGLVLKARAGLHVGEVLTWHNSDEAVSVGAKPMEVEGLAKPMAARLMTLARPGQILLSAVAESLLHRSSRELGERAERLLWKSHGRWRFKGVPTAQEIYEVGEVGITPLRGPKSSGKAWRDIPIWRRPPALIAEAALLVAIGVGSWLATRSEPAIAFAERDWVLVGDVRNLTGDVRLDDAGTELLKISLQQSRHLNVLSDAKVREVLQNMRKDPASTTLDRNVASEVAIRSGARAVVLPAVAMVGGKIRFSAEVVNPTNQATVYTNSAEDKNANQLATTVDVVAADVRNYLGEQVEAIASDSVPLPDATTSSLDALRAFAIGNRYYSKRDFQGAAGFYAKAIEIDPDFVLAYLALMRVNISSARQSDALVYLDKALKRKAYLPVRDRMYAEAWQAEFGPKPWADGLQKWKMLYEMYPDYYAAASRYAWNEFVAGRYVAALQVVSIADIPQNPQRDGVQELRGRIYLAQGHPQKAINAFVMAERSGGYPPNRRHAAALASAQEMPAARTVLEQISTPELTNFFERMSVYLDAGDSRLALENGKSAMVASSKEKDIFPKCPLQVNFMALSLLTGGKARMQGDCTLPAIMKYAEASVAADRDDAVALAASIALIQQRFGLEPLPTGFEGWLEAMSLQSEFPPLAEMLVIIRSNRLVESGRAVEALSELRREINGESNLQMHVALRSAALAAGDAPEALRQTAWLAKSRGAAYIDPFAGQALQVLNVGDVVTAPFVEGKIFNALNEKDRARPLLDGFARAYPMLEYQLSVPEKLSFTEPASKQ
jgi:putative peptide modification system cyclase